MRQSLPYFTRLVVSKTLTTDIRREVGGRSYGISSIMSMTPQEVLDKAAAE